MTADTRNGQRPAKSTHGSGDSGDRRAPAAGHEVERKYAAGPGTRLPDLTEVKGVARSESRGVTELDAVYYDTADLRLAAAGITLRRRTGGADAGWHLKLPVAPDTREELTVPLDAAPGPAEAPGAAGATGPAGSPEASGAAGPPELSAEVPGALAALVRARTRGAPLVPVVRLLSSRDLRRLSGRKGGPRAELSTDTVVAERLTGGRRTGKGRPTAEWTEIEVELARDADPALLGALDKRLREAGLRPAAAPSKLARALTETGGGPAARPEPADPDTAGEELLRYLRAQADALLALDVAVRRELPDAVHKMRVATRRLRSALRSYRKLIGGGDRDAVVRLRGELKWLAGELGVDRDQEVLAERLTAGLDAVPVELLLGPVRARLRIWDSGHRAEARARTEAALDSDRYLALLDAVEALLARPPLRPAAARAPGDVLPRVLRKEHARLTARVERALALAPGPDRDVAMHEARKAAKRARYTAEAARPALGKPAKKYAKRVKLLQRELGDHQDSVVARETLRELAVRAHAAGETAFVWGLLYGHEEAAAAEREHRLPEVWAATGAP
ncbi:CYTH and CHAD domain-containing protein [Streptomyces sp. LP05-1]|uniref:CYTH and CHAD domain-containing protein n=1 Tax=Streptomyces pyxinae TaxID=2970734 RepID=A0ABT2CL01_9ACTN|nr:CYTH and CHAD domain-containing protein [Streptomyces sp. LP05-1]MCS0638099.1 CYTH and CHAD domain-containing protein [Streptomyces sp. LP05-1]